MPTGQHCGFFVVPEQALRGGQHRLSWQHVSSGPQHLPSHATWLGGQQTGFFLLPPQEFSSGQQSAP